MQLKPYVSKRQTCKVKSIVSNEKELNLVTVMNTCRKSIVPKNSLYLARWRTLTEFKVQGFKRKITIWRWWTLAQKRSNIVPMKKGTIFRRWGIRNPPRKGTTHFHWKVIKACKECKVKAVSYSYKYSSFVLNRSWPAKIFSVGYTFCFDKVLRAVEEGAWGNASTWRCRAQNCRSSAWSPGSNCSIYWIFVIVSTVISFDDMTLRSALSPFSGLQSVGGRQGLKGSQLLEAGEVRMCRWICDRYKKTLRLTCSSAVTEEATPRYDWTVPRHASRIAGAMYVYVVLLSGKQPCLESDFARPVCSETVHHSGKTFQAEGTSLCVGLHRLWYTWKIK